MFSSPAPRVISLDDSKMETTTQMDSVTQNIIWFNNYIVNTYNSIHLDHWNHPLWNRIHQKLEAGDFEEDYSLSFPHLQKRSNFNFKVWKENELVIPPEHQEWFQWNFHPETIHNLHLVACDAEKKGDVLDLKDEWSGFNKQKTITFHTRKLKEDWFFQRLPPHLQEEAQAILRTQILNDYFRTNDWSQMATQRMCEFEEEDGESNERKLDRIKKLGDLDAATISKSFPFPASFVAWLDKIDFGKPKYKKKHTRESVYGEYFNRIFAPTPRRRSEKQPPHPHLFKKRYQTYHKIHLK